MLNRAPFFHPSLKHIQRGIEKEGLRTSPLGYIAQTPHPAAIGSTLTHPHITTDYSEALLEFITDTNPSISASIDALMHVATFTSANIGDELIWPASMPCLLYGDESIPIAQYGSSNIGTMKHVYRRGLAIRYGRIMQSIAGIHYNFSLPDDFWLAYQQHLSNQDSLQDFKSCRYFNLIRNFRSQSWILHYLFGASPVLDKSFLHDETHNLTAFNDSTFGLEYATSLRMSDLGYQNSAQDALHVSYNSLEDYTHTLSQAVNQSYAPYAKLGVKKDGLYQQLNTNILQLENEYYSDIRPKRVTQSGEKPIHALRQRGVEYIEVRILDINPYLLVGIDQVQIHFMDAFLLSCLNSMCAGQETKTYLEIKHNQSTVINRGREPNVLLQKDGKEMPLKDLAHNMLTCIEQSAALLDQANSTTAYTKAVQSQRDKVDNVALTPSQKLMNEVHNGQEFIDICLRQAKANQAHFQQHPLSEPLYLEMQKTAQTSLEQQQHIEQSDTVDFHTFLAAYNQA